MATVSNVSPLLGRNEELGASFSLFREWESYAIGGDMLMKNTDRLVE